MRSSRLVLNLVALAAAAVFLSGCYVASKSLPAGEPVIDTQLVGAWQALGDDGKPSSDMTYLHFIKDTDGTPLVVVMVDDHSANTYEMRTIKLGNKQMFALKLLTATNKSDMPEPNYILGFYQVKGDDLIFNLLDPKKLKTFLDAHKINGVAEKGDYGKVTLTGSPQELAAFFASTDPAALIGGEKPARAHRLTQPK
jgi:hypothetical protein